ncbi:MAG: 30S ribosome-binding factor RbfA [Gammaproteobacteria bacterium]
MPREFGRNQRVAGFIKQELAILIQRAFPLNDYGMITVTEVDVSPDLKNAKIFVTTLGDKLSADELVAALNEESGSLRHDLSQVLTSRGVPVLTFLYDKSIARAQRIDEIIGSFRKGEDDNKSD